MVSQLSGSLRVCPRRCCVLPLSLQLHRWTSRSRCIQMLVRWELVLYKCRLMKAVCRLPDEFLFINNVNSHQLNYSIIEKETLALNWALKYFYVGGGVRPLVVYTDHNPLTFLHSLQNPNQRLMHWCLFLQPFHLKRRTPTLRKAV